MRSEFFLEEEGVDSVGIVVGHCLDYEIAVAFVEREGGSVINGGFEDDAMAGGVEEAIFGGLQELRANPEAPGFGKDVDGDDVADVLATSFGDDEAYGRFLPPPPPG